MKLPRFFTNNRFLARLVTSYLIISILLTSILMIVVSSFVSSKIKDKTTEAAIDLLRQSYSTAYYALTDIYGDYYDLWSKDEMIVKALNSIEISNDTNKLISDNFDREIFRNDLIDSIYLINNKSNTVTSNISTCNLNNFYDPGALSLFEEFDKYYDSYKNELFFPRKATIDLKGTESIKNLISIVYATKDLNGNLSSGIIVNIDQDKFSNLIDVGNESNSMIIVNRSGKIISDLNGSFGVSLPRDDLYSSIANNPNTESSLSGDYFGKRSFVTYKKATDLGFVFISITPYSVLKHEVLKTEGYMAMFFLIAMIISLVVSFLSTKKIYEPLNTLIQRMKDNPSVESSISGDEYAFLGQAYNNLILKDKASHISRIYHGSFSDNSIEILNFKKNDKYMSSAMIPDYDLDISNGILDDIVSLINLNTRWSGAATTNSCVSCIINDTEFSDEKVENIMEVLINLQKIISDELNITVSIGLGTIVNNLDSIKFSHRYAMLAVQYALINGGNQVILYNDIENSKVAASQNKDSIADKIQEHVNKNFTRQDFSVDEIADEIELSLSYIRQIFKSEKGITLNDYIIHCRIEMSKTLLSTTDKTAKEIAHEVGYYDNRYFYTLFKKKAGMTTDEFRKSKQEASTL